MPVSRAASILPWVEASTILSIALVGAIATGAISLYRIDSIENKIGSIENKVDDLVEAVGAIGVIQSEIESLKNHDKQAQMIFTKFAESVDRLSIAVAKLEVRTDGT